MLLKFLGRGSAFNSKEGNNSAFFIRQAESIKHLVLIDCGCTTYSKIQELNLLEDVNKVTILITHLHPDHMGSLGTLIFDCSLIRGIKPKVITPCKELYNILKYQGVEADIYNFINVNEDSYYGISYGVISKFVISKHVDEIKSYGLEICIDDKKLWYSGDSNEINKEYFNSFLRLEIDEFYQDTAFIKSKAHLHYKKLIDTRTDSCGIIQYNTEGLYAMHIDSDELIEELEVNGINIVQLVK